MEEFVFDAKNAHNALVIHICTAAQTFGSMRKEMNNNNDKNRQLLNGTQNSGEFFFCVQTTKKMCDAHSIHCTSRNIKVNYIAR